MVWFVCSPMNHFIFRPFLRYANFKVPSETCLWALHSQSTPQRTLRAGFHCGSAAPLLVFRGLKRHHYHSDRGSPRAFATILDQKLRAAVAARPVPRTLHCFVRQNFKIQLLILCAGQNTRICLISRVHARAGR